ncbi:MAG: HupE/UreJ family protein [bacterium]|nr:HupE/UreJ family protein [bacterium]
MPDDAQQFRFGASRAFGPLRVTLVDQSTGRSETHLLGAGEDTPLFALGTAPTAQSGSVVWRYVALGFEHIVPLGADHILFVLGLFLLSTRMRPLLVQVTAFTVAHTVTLALSMRGVVSLPSGPVEALIALSIAYVAIENLVTTELKPWRPALVFAFGLLHGLGFAEVLRELGLPDDRFAGALIGFNVGVELGQLAVIGIAFLVVGRFRDRDWYRSRVVVPASLLIAAAGLWWCITRTF